jgi:hypothetical protein
MIELAPKTFDEKTPCAYGLSPARPSSGNLEADARAAILEALPGWEIKADHQYNALRGVAAAGWPYYVFATDVKKLEGGSYKYLEAITMAFPSNSGRVSILWGFGPPAHVLNDLSLVSLFHSLRPRGWNSDGGKAFLQELQGTWRDSNSSGLAQYKFMANGRYEYGYGVITSTGIQETRFSSVSDGRYELRGSELTLIPDRRDRGPSKYRPHLRRTLPRAMVARDLITRRQREIGAGSSIYANREFPLTDALRFTDSWTICFKYFIETLPICASYLSLHLL